MFTPELFRAKATECAELAKSAASPDAAREFVRREQSYAMLAENEQWLTDHPEQTVQVTPDKYSGEAEPGSIALTVEDPVAEEEDILRSLGAALVMRWKTLPAKLRRELSDCAASIDAALEAGGSNEQIARFLAGQLGGESAIVQRYTASSGLVPELPSPAYPRASGAATQ